MRISLVEYNSCYKHFNNFTDVIITLDGIAQTSCVCADTRQGLIIRYKTDARGNLITLNGELVTECLYGHVVIRAESQSEIKEQ